MSIDYYGVTTDDHKRIGDLLERGRQADIAGIDVDAIHTALTMGSSLAGAQGTTLEWNGSEGGYINATVYPAYVHVNQNTVRDELGLDVMIDVMSALTTAGLNVWDPQQGNWFPGSPTLKAKTKKPAAKAKPPAKKAVAKKSAKKAAPTKKRAVVKKAKPAAKPKTKAKAKTKAKSKKR